MVLKSPVARPGPREERFPYMRRIRLHGYAEEGLRAASYSPAPGINGAYGFQAPGGGISGARMEVCEGDGHMPYFERHEEVNERIERFIQSLNT